MNDGVIFLGLIVLAFFIGGSISGIVALSKMQRLFRGLEDVKRQLRSLRDDLKKHEAQGPVIEKESTAPPRAAPGFEEVERQLRSLKDDLRKQERPAPVTEREAPPVTLERPAEAAVHEEIVTLNPPNLLLRERAMTPPSPPSSEGHPRSLEMKLGGKWLNWVGIVMLLVGIGFFLKYAYDNAWIGPKGRLAIGVFLGIISLGLGERFRRRAWSVLFQVLTGGGLATFYLCVFFSFQVYRLADQPIAMILAASVTALAVILAVAYDALPIAILAVIGGFLSPVLLSTGTNHPYALFTYIAILDMVAMGVAYFRRWRALDLLCFIGTIVMYLGWHQRFYAPDQMTPALAFTSLFYLMFLLIPTLHGLVRRLPLTVEGLVMIVFSALFSFFSYYSLLFRDYRYFMGFTVLGQALLVFLLFQVWSRRVGTDNDTSAGFLTITLGLVIVAIPIQLRLYGIPIAWSMEGTVLVLLGIRFRQIICRVAGLVALMLAAGGLVYRLPLHVVPFTSVLNIPFGSWSLVIAMTAIAACMLHRKETGHKEVDSFLTGIFFLLALVLACSLFSLEISGFWTVNHPVAHYRTYETGSLVALWSLIPIIIAFILVRRGAKAWMPLPWICSAIGGFVLFASLEHYSYPSRLFALNASFLPKLIFVLSLWVTASLYRRLDLKLKHAADVHALAGHAILAMVVAFEFARWGHYSTLITPKMSFSLISAAWALQAFLVIWIGLARQIPLLRYLGFALFLLAVGKTLIVDMSEMEKVYRIVSFAACGLLLVGAGYFYQRYSSRLRQRPDLGTET
jgi:uncharacterized membrane protein